MKTIQDCFGRLIRSTDERIALILRHPETADMESEIVRVLQAPAEVRCPVQKVLFSNSMAL